MKKIKHLLALVALSMPLWVGHSAALAAGGAVHLDKAPDRTNDKAALQHGAKLFVNYCLNCHSAEYVRYTKLRDLGLTDKQITDYLLVTNAKIGDVMKANIDPKQAKDWLGKNPPDLSLAARSRASANGSGPDYLYTFLRGFYKDETKVTGWNNTAFPSVGMPHVLWELQGVREAIHTEVESHGEKTHVISDFKTIQPGTMSQKEYDNAVADLVAFMTWMAEPNRHDRIRTGVWVMMFLLLFMLVAWRLNASFWKDVK